MYNPKNFLYVRLASNLKVRKDIFSIAAISDSRSLSDWIVQNYVKGVRPEGPPLHNSLETIILTKPGRAAQGIV